ncbi:hypothetical protein QAD02_009976 [Eretmocerus hayati]|uniref:Uncharacterized protein n=1 Tax=Eretmocerus hayati TaxID=131215 RepID=A0ACC2NC20_9HYME|nr:hypothetical protein QAD02_009976 [Eretmocerus hayati]
MESSRTLVLVGISLSIFSICITAEIDEFSNQWNGGINERIIVTPNLDRTDRGILYGVIRSSYSVAEDSLELFLELPEQEFYKLAIFPKNRLDATALYSFGPHHAILIHTGRRYNDTISGVRGLVINLNEGKIFPIDVPSDFYQNDFLNIVVYSETFDMMVNHRSICKKSDRCRITFDQFGKRVGEPKIYPTKENWLENTIIPANRNSLDDGFYVELFDESIGKDKISFVDKNGAEKSVVKDLSFAGSISNTNGIFTTCGSNKFFSDPSFKSSRRDNYANCLRYNWKTKKITNTSILLSSSDATVQSVTNLAGGGVAFLTFRCASSINDCPVNSFDVTMVDVDGKAIQKGPFPLNLKCSRFSMSNSSGRLVTVQSSAIENGDEICLSFTCIYKDNRIIEKSTVELQKLQFYNRCLSKKIFVKT